MNEAICVHYNLLNVYKIVLFICVSEKELFEEITLRAWNTCLVDSCVIVCL